MLLVQINHVTAGYDSKKDVLIDVSLQIAERDFLCIVGPNGGGKTTLLRVLLGLLKPRIGAVNFYRDGQPIPKLPVGYLPQVNAIDRRFPISVAEVVASGFLAETRGRRCSAEQRQRVEAVIDRMGLNDLARRPIGELSGGELQRTMLGRAIVAHPRLLVLDEPNTYMDRRFGDTLGDLLSEINREAAVVLVSHDPGALRPLIKNMAFVRRQLRYVPGNDLSAVSLDSEESESMISRSRKSAQFVEHASRTNPIPTKDRIRPVFLFPVLSKYMENTHFTYTKPAGEEKAVAIFIPSLPGFR